VFKKIPAIFQTVSLGRVLLGGLLFVTLLAPKFASADALSAAAAAGNAVNAGTAAGPGMPTTVVGDLPASLNRASDSAVDVVKKSVTGAIVAYVINLMSFAADKAAYDAAVLIATGGNGGAPLVDQSPIKTYGMDLMKATAGEAVGLLDDQITGPGKLLKNFNLCAPSSTPAMVAIKLGIKSIYQEPVPKCDINQVASHWQEFASQVASNGGSTSSRTQQILGGLARLSDPSVSEFSVTTNIQSRVLAKSIRDATAGEQNRLANGGFKDVTDFITKQVTTPASMIQDDFSQKNRQRAETRTALGAAIVGNSDALLQVGIHAGAMFTNTLLSALTEKLYNGFFDTNASLSRDPFNPNDFASASNAKQSFRSLLAVAPLQITNFSILADFGSCPQNGRGLYNCVADNSFISAIARASSGEPLTIQDAMDQGLLRPDWPLISSSDHARDQDPYCYTYGYCHTNLVKLRKARVISVGWEFAADSTGNSANSPVTLREVVAGFDDCNAGGQPDDTHKWCKLIDPNWVLKYPETQCRAAVNGQLLTTGASNERQTECVDMPSCIAEDAGGNCTGGYGYCVREENIWRFRGESCPAQFASCITVKNDTKTVSYLQNTTDAGPCTADNAGCAWYATEKTKDSTGAFTYPAIPRLLTADVRADLNPDVYKTRTYFTGAVESCDSSEGGCSQVIKRDDSLRLNMLVNPSFDQDTDRNTLPDGWIFTNSASSKWDNTGSVDRSGSGAVKTGAGTVYQTGIEFSQSRFYTMSFYARQEFAGGTAKGDMLIDFTGTADDGSAIDLGGTSITSSCLLRDGNGDGKMDMVEVTGTPAGIGYERFSCTFTSPTQLNPAARLFAFVNMKPSSVFMDDIQVEQGQNASAYHDGYSRTNFTTSVVKVAPSYLGCTGSANDAPECAKFAKVCSENDVGCTAYTPVNGDPVVTGVADFGLPNVLDGIDECPQVCNGYDTYKQEPTRYEPNGLFPLYLIPATAKSCTQQQVGCDEFTNLSDESKAYFTYIRACVTPAQAQANTSSDNEATFYTWEGSDTSGFQLKTWSLLESNAGATPYIYLNSTETDVFPDKAPCSTFNSTPAGIICADNQDGNGDLHPDWDTPSFDALGNMLTCNKHGDLFNNPDCREFYDADGNIHYRLWSKTVTVDTACSVYRKTDVAGDSTAERTTICTASGGYFDPASGTCRYNGFAPNSKTCPAVANGCRSYTGGRSRNSREIKFAGNLGETFESGSLSAWTAPSAVSVTYSNESLATGGHSLSASVPFETYVGDNGTLCTDANGCVKSGGALGGTCTVAPGERYCGTLEGQLVSGTTYTVSFWAKGIGTLTTAFDYQATGTPELDAGFGTVTLTSGWQQYSLGPLNMNAPGFGPGTALAFLPSGSVFIDNIVIRAGQDKIALIKKSWVTPAVCDQTPNGASAPQHFLGCQEYKDPSGASSFLKSFSKLCSQDKVGCQSYFMTQESASSHAEIHNATCGTLNGSPASVPTLCYYSSLGSSYDTASPQLCTIGVGSSTCTFNLNWYVSPGVLSANPATAHLKFAPSTLVTPADKDAFLVVTPAVTCSNAGAGCTEYGQPIYNQGRTATTGAKSVFLKNDPSAYAKELCTQDALFCSAWTGTSGTNYYFKDPGDKTCDYRTDVTVGTTSYDGWFKTGTNELCYSAPAYIVGGNTSGIWKNGDAKYQGWVGTCKAQYNSCSEYQDPLDVSSAELYGTGDGAQYFSLASSIGVGRSASATADCNGQVSLKEGCGLFNNTSTAAKTFNASATEMSSTHADTLFNTAQFSLVNPIDCSAGSSVITLPDGVTKVDLCASRCIYDNSRIHDITDHTAGDNFVYGGSCYTSADCPTIDSETGKKATATACGATINNVTVPRLANDTNAVLKVNRDRQCSQWLSCADAQTVWDERTNSYKTICGDVGLCQQYSAQGNSSFCSQWNFEDPQVVLDASRYTSRNITWYGDDYSGLAIPNTFPVETLSQANVALPANTCQYGPNAGAPCSPATFSQDCNEGAAHRDVCPATQSQDFRLVLNAGSCKGQVFGSACSVGTCSLTGATCRGTSDCGNGGGSCVVGQCFTVTPTDLCTSDAQCGSTRVCNGGVCARPGSVINTEDYALLGADVCPGQLDVFVPSVGQKVGTCVNDSCLLAPDGQAFAFGETEGKSCRAYPETTSPFSNGVVKSWFDTATQQKATDSQVGVDDVAYETISGFDHATLCAPGEDCVCTYKKVTYGEGTGTRYYSRSFATSGKGICSGGPFNGMSCTVTLDCATADGSGICVKPTREDTLLGMDGYCLERDSGININGDRSQNACVTWLPVDQLAGSSDLYGKYTSAGYNNDLFYCAEVKGYTNISPIRACSLAPGVIDVNSTNKGFCKTTMNCPAGFFAVGGPANRKDSTNSDGTTGSSSGVVCQDVGDVAQNSCPFLCVPFNSFHTATGSSCGTPTAEGLDDTVDYESGTLTYTNTAAHPTPYYFVRVTDNAKAYAQTDLLLNKYKDCTYYGAKAEGDELGYYNYPDEQNLDGANQAKDFIFLSSGSANWPIDAYPACEALLQAGSSDPSVYNAVWTDRLLNPASDLVGIDVGGARKIQRDTELSPFGHSLSAEQGDQGRNTSNDPTPAVVPACITQSYTSTTLKLPVDLNNPSACMTGYAPAYGNNDNPAEAQSFLGWGSILANVGLVSGGETGRPTIVDDLKKLFVAPVGIWKWSSGATASALKIGGRALGSYAKSSLTADYSGEYKWDDRATQGHPPTVWAIDPTTCNGTECEEGPINSVTLNDQNAGEIMSSNFLRASLKFYAAADKNQLPLRRVIVNWGDDSTDSGSSATDNFYKNHRGLQSGGANSKCKLGTEWGLTDESCDPNYFTYSHIYTCSSSFLLSYSAGVAKKCELDASGNLKNSPCVNLDASSMASSCSFQPHVHVRDNWGWCSGTCTDTTSDQFTDNLPGCYDGDGSIDLNSPTIDECNYSKYPRTPTDYENPWVYYDGIVTVNP
jgi:hypothetical protein